jgi:hypothetical protein
VLLCRQQEISGVGYYIVICDEWVFFFVLIHFLKEKEFHDLVDFANGKRRVLLLLNLDYNNGLLNSKSIDLKSRCPRP